MPNEKHIQWLLEGVEAWNARRAEEDFRPDFIRADIRQAFKDAGKLEGHGRISLSGANLIGADLRGANLRGANLGRTNLNGAYLRGAKLTAVNLVGAGLREADLRAAKLGAADLGAANLGGANLTVADLGAANLRGANLGGANLGEANLGGADLRGADLSGAIVITIVYSASATNEARDAKYTDLSKSLNLTQEQVDEMKGDSGTILPDHITRPAHWPDLDNTPAKSNVPTQPERAEPALPETPLGNTVELSGGRLVIGPDQTVPKRGELEALYVDLREAVQDVRDLGHLSNQSPLLAKGIERFLRRIPGEFIDLEQVRFGVGLQALRLQFEPEKAYLLESAPEKAGHIEALLLYADLIAARLPQWQDFLREEEDERSIVEARVEDTEAILETAAEALINDPEHFDISLFDRIREYLDDKTIEAYLASKNLLLAIAHKTFSLVREFLTDTASEQRKQAIKNIATALNVQLGAVLLQLAGLLPKELHWLVAWLEYLPKVLA